MPYLPLLAQSINDDNFTPLSLPDKGFWLDSTRTDGYTLVSGRGSQWNDLYGNSNNAVQGTAAQRPLFVASGINAKGSFHFRDDSATPRMLAITDSVTISSTAFTCFIVWRRTNDLADNEHIIGKWDIVNNKREWRILGQLADDKIHAQVSTNGTSAAVTQTGADYAVNTNYIIEVSYDGTNLMTAMNGGAYTLSSVGTPNQSDGALTIGAEFDTQHPSEGQSPEVIYQNAHMSAFNKGRTLRYLSNKFEISVP